MGVGGWGPDMRAGVWGADKPKNRKSEVLIIISNTLKVVKGKNSSKQSLKSLEKLSCC